MSLIRWISPAALALTLVGATAAHHTARTDAHEQRLTQYVQRHLDSVLTELSARDDRALTPAQREHRHAVIETLAAYRNAGAFPHNYDFPGEAVPYFVDRKTGVRCAVGYLLESTGRADIVSRVAQANNNVRVRELAGDTAVAGWLDENGLTLAEAARIQVVYVTDAPSPMQVAANVGFYAAGPIAAGTALAASVWNATSNRDGHRALGNVLGLTAGVASVATGLMLASNTQYNRVGYMTAAIGVASMALASRSMYERRAIASRETSRKRAEVSIAPIVPVGGSGTGLAVSLRF